MKLDKEHYEKFFKNFSISDCVVRTKDLFYFVLERNENERVLETRIVSCSGRPGTKSWGMASYKGMRRMVGAVSYQPREQFVGVTLYSQVYLQGSGEVGLEHMLKSYNSIQLKESNAKREEYLLRGAITRLRTIDGRVYGCGLGRCVIDRREKNDWHYHLDLPVNQNVVDPNGFSDIDGFGAADIYAVGGRGDVWHYDGLVWKQMPFPSDMDLVSVCCAGDGFVYIGAESGSLFKGRHDQWVLIERGATSLPFKDIVWYDSMLWCTSDDGLWTVENDKLRPANVEPGMTVCSGNLSVQDGVMLLAGAHGAALYDGEKWRRIIGYSDFPSLSN